MDKIISNADEADDTTLTDSGFYWLQKGEVKVLVSRALEAAGFANGFSTRLGGVSAFPENDLNLAGFDEDSLENIEENRRRFLGTIGADFRLTSVWQIHGNSIKTVRSEDDINNTEDKHDGLVCDLPGILIGVKTADCVPVLIGDPVSKAFAAIHAGWRGTSESIVSKAVGRLVDEYGSSPENLISAIGPAAGFSNYEIGQDVIDAFSENFPDSPYLFNETRPGHALIDLHTANCEQLVAAGVEKQHIFRAPFCTIERTDLFFSYRAEKRLHGRCGRLMSVIGLK